MTDDLVKRLRSPTEHEAWLWSVPYQAANRIEKLEAALREIDTIAIRHIKGGIGKAQIIARKALEGKDD